MEYISVCVVMAAGVYALAASPFKVFEKQLLLANPRSSRSNLAPAVDRARLSERYSAVRAEPLGAVTAETDMYALKLTLWF